MLACEIEEIWAVLVDGNHQAHLSSPSETDINIFYTGKYPLLSITSVLLELDSYYIFSRYFIYLKMQFLCGDLVYLQIEVNSGKVL